MLVIDERGSHPMSISSMIEADRFRSKLALLESERTRGSTSCNRSGVCCWKRPGQLTQEDLKRLAGAMGVSEREFFRTYCAVDEFDRGICVILRRKHQTGGKWISAEESFSIESPCVFLDDEARVCEVHEIKPSECAVYQCWAKPDTEVQVRWTHEQILALGWDGDKFDYDNDYEDDYYA